MSITVNKQLSSAKELFLSVALMAQEISSETVREMKKDFGDSVIRNSLIKTLKKRGYIQKNRRAQFLRICPDRRGLRLYAH